MAGCLHCARYWVETIAAPHNAAPETNGWNARAAAAVSKRPKDPETEDRVTAHVRRHLYAAPARLRASAKMAEVPKWPPPARRPCAFGRWAWISCGFISVQKMPDFWSLTKEQVMQYEDTGHKKI